MRKLFPTSVYNPITFTGLAISAISFGLIIFLFILEFFADDPHPYMGILAFIILPGILIIGLLLVAVGIIREKRRETLGFSRGGRFPEVNLNDPKQLRIIIIFSTGTLILLLFSAFGSYKAYEYTESDSFCGTICHEVMEPEYTAYLSSPHSRVGCVKCHIGSGASWFVQAKISGAYQVYSVLFNKYSRPIPTPVHELRPAEGTCEHCHSPEHFFSEIKYSSDYFLYDEINTKSSISMLLKIGGGRGELGKAEGIHWHMDKANSISYIHTDEKRNVIPWVRLNTNDGKTITFRNTEIAFDENNYDEDNLRIMDCIDCHNRPSHIFNPADKSVNLSLSMSKVDVELPYIKSIAVEALEFPYSNKVVGMDSIKTFIEGFYRTNYPELSRLKKQSILKSIIEIQKIYARNYFPKMTTNWKAFPNHISHLYDTGCFRCHDGKHVSEDGKIISKDCNLCHTIIEQVTPDGEQHISLSGLDFIHPVDLDKSIKELECVDCHARERNEEKDKEQLVERNTE